MKKSKSKLRLGLVLLLSIMMLSTLELTAVQAATKGWYRKNNEWYYRTASGKNATGWLKYKGERYYLSKSKKKPGKMLVGWHKIQGKWCYFDRDGEYERGTKRPKISVARAKKIVYAKISGEKRSTLSIKLDYDDGKPYYEGRIENKKYRYEFEINALTGRFRIEDRDKIATKAKLTMAQAKSIVLKTIPNAQPSTLRIELDYDDGIPYYEGTVRGRSGKYEFEINAVTKRISYELDD